MILLATATASDGVAPVWWHVALGCFVISAVLALITLGASLFSRNAHHRPWLRLVAIAAIVLSLLPLGFCAYIHHIDFVEVGGDGTRASGPLWEALIFPSLPVIVSLLGMLISSWRQR